jgi:hemerythrin-like domain-containing protein
MTTDRCRSQHAMITLTLMELERDVCSSDLFRDAGSVRATLEELEVMLSVHLAVEENVVYPQVLKSADPAMRATIEAFVAEMRSISELVKAYMRRWLEGGAIEAAAGEFVVQSQKMTKLLRLRIRRENLELLPAADRLSAIPLRAEMLNSDGGSGYPQSEMETALNG